MIVELLTSSCIAVGTTFFLLYLGSFRSNTLEARITKTHKNQKVCKTAASAVKFRFRESRALNPNSKKALYELPDFIELLSMSLDSGNSVFNSIAQTSSRARGVVADQFQLLAQAMKFGSSFEFELNQISERLPNQQLREMCSKLILASARGSALSSVLKEQGQSIRLQIQNQNIKQAGKNETRMMIPLVFLILPITILFALYPSVQLLNLEIL